mmetsp:Transcript_37745/g.45605  ORF Transcript_37745/g.45605 Transcript_37745/m.45605 type:complete len:238 (+) Transcript_37745:225-938(+)
MIYNASCIPVVTVAKSYHHLVEYDIVQHLEIPLPQFLRELFGTTMQRDHQFMNPAGSQILQRRPEFHHASPSRHLRRVQHAVAILLIVGQITPRGLKSGHQGVGVGTEQYPVIVGGVQRLVAVDRPRLRFVHALGETGEGRVGGGPRPQSEGSVDVHPRTRFHRQIAHRVDGIKAAGVHVARLEYHDSILIQRGERIQTQPSLIIRPHIFHVVQSKSQERNRLRHGAVGGSARHDAD